MSSICDYCHSPNTDDATKCESCGAPVIADPIVTDFRHCPFCNRALLALGSPACNYCGRRLPESLLKARDADLSRINQIAGEHRPSEDQKEKLAGFVGASLLRRSEPEEPVSDLVSLVSELFQ